MCGSDEIYINRMAVKISDLSDPMLKKYYNLYKTLNREYQNIIDTCLDDYYKINDNAIIASLCDNIQITFLNLEDEYYKRFKTRKNDKIKEDSI